MYNYSTDSTDLKSLIGTEIPSEYISHERERELLEGSCDNSEPLTCYFCSQPIEPDQSINLHHPIYRSHGGTQVEPAHERCHVEYHSRQGDFKKWGRQSAATRRWAFNLKNVKDNPAYEFDRQYYLALYSH
jgi:hypothetical protein